MKTLNEWDNKTHLIAWLFIANVCFWAGVFIEKSKAEPTTLFAVATNEDFTAKIIRQEIAKMADEGRLILLDANGVLHADLIAFWQDPDPDPNPNSFYSLDHKWIMAKGTRIYFEKETE